MNILIAEDEPHIEKLLISCVQEVSPSADIYITGRSSEALNIARNRAIDLFSF